MSQLCSEYKSMKEIELFNKLIIEVEDMGVLNENCQQKALLMLLSSFKLVRPSTVAAHSNQLYLGKYSDIWGADIQVEKRQTEDFNRQLHKMQEVLRIAKECLETAELDIVKVQRDEKSEAERSHITSPRVNMADEISQMNRASVYSENSHTENIGRDWWSQLKRISIPVFSGDKATYESWRAAFVACIDKAPATPEYKLLQLRQYVAGDALRCIEKLGHSAAAYEAAKERLERKFGGERRKLESCLEDLKSFRPLTDDNPEDIEAFADIVDLGVINLRELGRTIELDSAGLLMTLQRKMTEKMVVSFHRWMRDKNKEESVETLREWLLREADYHTTASETVHGLAVYSSRNGHSIRYSSKTYCDICRKNHDISSCDQFLYASVKQRWEVARSHGLCFRCLQKNHLGQGCPNTRICSVNGCQHNHHPLLHSP